MGGNGPNAKGARENRSGTKENKERPHAFLGPDLTLRTTSCGRTHAQHDTVSCLVPPPNFQFRITLVVLRVTAALGALRVCKMVGALAVTGLLGVLRVLGVVG